MSICWTAYYKETQIGNVNFQRQNLELIQNDHWNFQLQNLREVIQTTMEISKVNISVQLIENDDGIFRRQNFGWYKWRRKFPKAESGVNRKWPWKFPTSKLWLMQNDHGNFQGKHFELSKWPWKFPTSKLWLIQDDHGNFQIQIWSSCKMTLEISKVKISVSLIQTTMEIYVAYLKWPWKSTT